MPKHLPSRVKTFSRRTTHPTHLALAKMGHGPCWAATTIARGEQVYSRRIFYKMDWCQATCNNHTRNSEKVHLAEHNLQNRSAKNLDSWQWETIRLRQIQWILQKHKHQDSLRHSIPPRVKRSGGKSQQGNILSNIKDLIQPPQRQMSRRTVEGYVVP